VETDGADARVADMDEKLLSGRRPGRRFTSLRYTNAQLLVQVLKQCGDELTRENVMKQAANLKDLRTPHVLPACA